MNDNHPLTNGTYNWGDATPEYRLYVNGKALSGSYDGKTVHGSHDCLKDACLAAQKVLVEGDVPAWTAVLIVNEGTNVVECVVTDDANGIVYHKPDMGDR